MKGDFSKVISNKNGDVHVADGDVMIVYHKGDDVYSLVIDPEDKDFENNMLSTAATVVLQIRDNIWPQ